MLREKFKKRNMLLLFLTLVALIVFIPQSENNPWMGFIVNIVNALILLSWIYAFSTNKKHLYLLSLIWIFIFIFFVIDITMWIRVAGSRLTYHFLIVWFYSFTIWVLFSNLLSVKKVSANTIFWAVNTFILLGLLWTTFYSTILFINPEAFSITFNQINGSTILYFSFCTLTTLGHWDIIPLTPIAKSAVILESIMWVMYIAIIIPRFIGLYIWDMKKRIEKIEKSI